MSKFIQDYLTGRTLPADVRHELARDRRLRKIAVEVARRGPRSRRLVIESIRGVIHFKLEAIHLAIVSQEESIPVDVIRQIDRSPGLGGIMTYEMIRNYPIYKSRLSEIERVFNGNFEKQLSFVGCVRRLEYDPEDELYKERVECILECFLHAETP